MYVIPKNISLRKSVGENLVPTSPIIISFIVFKIVMLNTYRAISKKNIISKIYIYIVNILKEFIKTITIIKQIFDLEVSLIIGKLLGSIS